MGWKVKIIVTNHNEGDKIMVWLEKGTQSVWDEYYTVYRTPSVTMEETFYITGVFYVGVIITNPNTNVEIIIEEWKSPLPFFF